jgi:hypothetical protein
MGTPWKFKAELDLTMGPPATGSWIPSPHCAKYIVLHTFLFQIFISDTIQITP